MIASFITSTSYFERLWEWNGNCFKAPLNISSAQNSKGLIDQMIRAKNAHRFSCDEHVQRKSKALANVFIFTKFIKGAI